MPRNKNVGPTRRLRRAGWLLPVLALACQAAAQSDGPTAATDTVARLHRILENAAADYPAGDVDARYAALQSDVTAIHNIPAIARFVLRRYWSDLSAQQQSDFIERFSVLSVMNYASRFLSLEKNAFRIVDAEKVNEDRVRVDAELQADNRTVSFVYTLIVDEGQWRVVNVVADGVSDLALKRAEYSKVMQDKGFDGLMQHVESQIEALR